MNNNDDINGDWRKLNEIRAERIAKWIKFKKIHVSKRNYYLQLHTKVYYDII